MRSALRECCVGHSQTIAQLSLGRWRGQPFVSRIGSMPSEADTELEWTDPVHSRHVTDDARKRSIPFEWHRSRDARKRSIPEGGRCRAHLRGAGARRPVCLAARIRRLRGVACGGARLGRGPWKSKLIHRCHHHHHHHQEGLVHQSSFPRCWHTRSFKLVHGGGGVDKAFFPGPAPGLEVRRDAGPVRPRAGEQRGARGGRGAAGDRAREPVPLHARAGLSPGPGGRAAGRGSAPSLPIRSWM